MHSNQIIKTLFSEELEEYEYIYASVRPQTHRKDIELDFSKLCQLTNQTSVLSIYGSQDYMGLKECGHFANLLNRGRYAHHLTLIPNADRCFQGIGNTEHEEVPNTSSDNPRENSIDFNNIVHEVIVDYLRSENEIQRFFSVSLQGRGSLRWHLVQGISNFRDIGGWRIDSSRSSDTDEVL